MNSAEISTHILQKCCVKKGKIFGGIFTHPLHDSVEGVTTGTINRCLFSGGGDGGGGGWLPLWLSSVAMNVCVCVCVCMHMNFGAHVCHSLHVYLSFSVHKGVM